MIKYFKKLFTDKNPSNEKLKDQRTIKEIIKTHHNNLKEYIRNLKK